MIVQLRGTSGSGKSTVMRTVMGLMGDWQAEYVAGRKRPLYYRSVSEWPLTIVLGHYESACGGCDTIGSAKAVYDLTWELSNVYPGAHFLQEGLLLSEDSKWTSQMWGEARCLFFTTPLARCLTQIEGRRAAAGNDKPLNPANTENRVKVIERARLKLLELGVPCRRASADQAPGIVLNWLRGT